MRVEFGDERLEFLYESHRLGTMRAASEFLDVAPSSISRQIANLERELGIALVEKGRHTVRLTPAGHLVIDYFRDRLARREALLSSIDDLRGQRKGHLTLSIGEGFIGTILLATLREYIRRFAGIQLSVQMAATNSVLAMVRDDEAHFGVVFDPPNDPKIRTRITVGQPLRLIVHPEHPLAKRTGITLQDLAGCKLVLPDNGFRARQLLQQVEAQANTYLDPAITTGSIMLIKACVQYQMGATILTELSFAEELRAGTLVAVPFEHEMLNSTRAHVITRLGRQLPSSAIALLELLENQIKRR